MIRKRLNSCAFPFVDDQPRYIKTNREYTGISNCFQPWGALWETETANLGVLSLIHRIDLSRVVLLNYFSLQAELGGQFTAFDAERPFDYREFADLFMMRQV